MLSSDVVEYILVVRIDMAVNCCNDKSYLLHVIKPGDPNRVMNIALVPPGPPMPKPEPREDPPTYEGHTLMPNTQGMLREGTNMSKMTDTGPPPPPPTKIGNQAMEGSMLSLKEERFEGLAVEAIPEEGKETELKQDNSKDDVETAEGSGDVKGEHEQMTNDTKDDTKAENSEDKNVQESKK